MTQKIFKIGNSAAVTIPKKIAKKLDIKIGDEVRVSLDKTGEHIIIEPVKDVM